MARLVALHVSHAITSSLITSRTVTVEHHWPVFRVPWGADWIVDSGPIILSTWTFGREKLYGVCRASQGPLKAHRRRHGRPLLELWDDLTSPPLGVSPSLVQSPRDTRTSANLGSIPFSALIRSLALIRHFTIIPSRRQVRGFQRIKT